ncbi:MAG: PQQ-binding-like beta-propeller repeat protein [Clostridia bacterium]|nr:PQQ-binding-like beta-propeller repeat protein [Clostridia bacterium]
MDADAIADANKPSAFEVSTKVYADGAQTSNYSRSREISIVSSEQYATLEGVTTFRGNNYRDGAYYGYVPNNASTIAIKYNFKIGGIDSWTGVGWTGQPAIVRWDSQTVQNMNIRDEKKAKAGLVEVIYATMDGKIYFFDLEDGEFTRDPIVIGAPIKGSVTIDPRGYPLLYVGQGIDEVNGEAVKIGMRIFSLIDQKQLLFINGRDEFATRRWYASDCAPIIDAATDTCIWSGENGLLYTITLNSKYDAAAGTVSIDPVIDRYWYSSKVTTRPGMENSVAVYNHYAFFSDNSGLITCLDLNSMKPLWNFYAGDDTDASLVIEETEDGVFIYTATELDLSAKSDAGVTHMRCLNAMTGEEIWCKDVKVTDSAHGGSFATPACGKGVVSDMVYYTIARVTTDGGRKNCIYALDKKTGAEVWTLDIGGYSWSSPTLAYDALGNAYLFQANSNGIMRMVNAKTGELITSIEVDGSNIEGSPAVFEDMLVIGTRGGRIHGIKIQ